MKAFFWLLILVICLFNFTSSAEAGRRPFIWVWDTEVVRQGDVELEQWLWLKKKQDMFMGWLWFSPIIGLTNRLELAFPWEVSALTGGATSLANFGMELRYRLTDPNDTQRKWHYLVRGAVQQNFSEPRDARNLHNRWLSANFVTSFGSVNGRHATLDLGITSDDHTVHKSLFNTTIAAGYAFPVNHQSRLAFEYLRESQPIGLYRGKENNMVGPTFSWSRGTTWLTFGTLFGLRPGKDADFMPRLIFGGNL